MVGGDEFLVQHHALGAEAIPQGGGVQLPQVGADTRSHGGGSSRCLSDSHAGGHDPDCAGGIALCRNAASRNQQIGEIDRGHGAVGNTVAVVGGAG